MALSVYDISVPVYLRLLAALEASLDKAVAHAEAGRYPPEALLVARLYPDMWSYAEQVKSATNHAFRGVARLAGLPIPPIPEAIATVADLKERIAATLAFVSGVDRAAVEAGGTREITFPLGGEQRTMSGKDYFLFFSLPNFMFHAATAYDILRHNGVPLSKADFLGPI